MKTKLFFYGTLKKSQSRGFVLRDQTFLGEALTTENYKMYNVGSFPALKEDNEKGISIKGELWEVDQDCLRNLDRIEGVPTFYNRVKVNLASHPNEDVQTYIFQHSVAGMPDCGDCW